MSGRVRFALLVGCGVVAGLDGPRAARCLAESFERSPSPIVQAAPERPATAWTARGSSTARRPRVHPLVVELGEGNLGTGRY